MQHDIDAFSQGADALEAGDFATASHCFEAWLQQAPQDADAWHNLGLARFYAGESEAARECWARALSFTREPEPIEDTIFEAASDLVHTQRRSAAAIGLFELLTGTQRYGRKAQLFLIWCLLANHRTPEAVHLAEAALRRYPDDLAFWLQNSFMLPPVFADYGEILAWRKRLNDCLDAFEAWLDSNPRIEHTDILTFSPIFSLMPMGFNEKETFRRISRLWRRLFVPVGADAPLPPRPRADRKLRLALISASVWNHSTIHYFLGMIEMLSAQADIETGIFYFGSIEDSITAHVKSLVGHYVQLTRELEPGMAAIRDWEPDVLMYLDIGQETLLYTMAHHRLAPVQCVSAGVPVTTGIDTIDYYLSSRLFEIPQAQDHYNEQLILLQHSMVCMRPPDMPPQLKPRAAFGIPDDIHFYFFPHTLFRVDPELDAILAQILLQDPKAEIYFMRLLNTELDRHLHQRFSRAHPELAHRLHYLPWLPQPDFLNLLALADVALDALRLCGGNVSFQSFWAGTPMVTCPTPFLRGRIASGLYRILGLDDWIASDWDDYLHKALLLGTQPDVRQALSERILAGRPLLFNREEGVAEMFGYFRAWGGRQ